MKHVHDIALRESDLPDDEEHKKLDTLPHVAAMNTRIGKFEHA